MADVRLTRKEEAGKLPNVCMCCGDAAATKVDHTFLLRPPHVAGPSVFLEVLAMRLLVASAQAPRLRLPTTFCARHRHYWLVRSALVFGGMAGMFLVLFAGLVGVIFLIAVARVDAPWLSCCVVVPFLLYLLAWVIPLKMVMRDTIRARLDEDDAVVLQNVGEGYAAAVEAARRSPS